MGSSGDRSREEIAEFIFGRFDEEYMQVWNSAWNIVFFLSKVRQILLPGNYNKISVIWQKLYKSGTTFYKYTTLLR